MSEQSIEERTIIRRGQYRRVAVRLRRLETLWVRAVRDEAHKDNVRPSDVAGYSRSPKVIAVRWRVWKNLHERYSLSLIAKASGYHHTTIMSARNRNWGETEQ